MDKMYGCSAVNFLCVVLIFQSGIMSSLPHMAMVPGAIGCGFVADWLIKRQIISITLCRKLFAVIG